MTLDDILAKTPDELKPVVAEYGPALLKMTTEEVWGWINLLAKGDVEEAYRRILANMTGPDLLTEWDTINAGWAAANLANKQKMAVMREASVAVCRALLTVALALVGL